jgi:hypothetical protein
VQTQAITHKSVLQHPHAPLAELYTFMLENATVDDSCALSPVSQHNKMDSIISPPPIAACLFTHAFTRPSRIRRKPQWPTHLCALCSPLRLMVMLHLVVERARGPASHIAPYIAALPATFSTPLCFTGREMDLLRGTVRHPPHA